MSLAPERFADDVVAPASSPVPATRPARGSARLGYLPGLDGLRALAVVSVLLYHASYSWALGGFLGVEVFFVISGYLITALLLAEWRDHQGIALGQFWLRRARRLLPALLLLLVLVSTIAVIFLPDEVASLRGDVLSALGYVTNWNFILVDKPYFVVQGRPSLVTHLWSLAVEEQFYLIWPLLFLGGMKLLGRRWFPVAVVAGAVASFVWMWILFDPTAGDPSRVYYGTDTRAAGLLIGCALAFVWSPWRLRPNVRRGVRLAFDVVGAVALILLAQMLVTTNQYSQWLYRGGMMRLDVITAVVIAVVVHPAARIGRVLALRPLVYIGQRSYGIYLYHFPIFMLTRPGIDVHWAPVPLFVFRFGLTLIVAELSYRYIEMPIRRGALGRRWGELRGAAGERGRVLRLRWTTAGVAAFGMLAVLVGATVIARPAQVPDYLAVSSTGPLTGFDVGATTTTESTTTTVPPTTAAPDPATAPAPPPSPVTEPPAPPTTPPPVTIPADATVSAIGDSVMLGAAPQLQALGPNVRVDAAVGRQVQTGLEMLSWYQSQGLLGDTVIVHLGNNGTFTASQFDQLMQILQGHRVIVLTVKVPRDWEGPNNQVILDGAARYPGVTLLDWKSAGEAHPEFFYADGMHLRPAGARFYADMIGYQFG